MTSLGKIINNSSKEVNLFTLGCPLSRDFLFCFLLEVGQQTNCSISSTAGGTLYTLHALQNITTERTPQRVIPYVLS